MAFKKILIVEDEKDIADLLAYNLKKEGFEVLHSLSAEQAKLVVSQQSVDAVLLDIMLPGMNGLDFCKYLRSHPKLSQVYIIFISARSEEIDRILGLEMGADDYVAKPFSPREVIARLKAVFRRERLVSSADGPKLIEAGEIRIDPDHHQAWIEKKEVSLTKIEFDLLSALAVAPNRVFSRVKLLQEVWGYDYYGDDRIVDVHVRRLRIKLRQASEKEYVQTVHGVGYKFVS